MPSNAAAPLNAVPETYPLPDEQTPPPARRHRRSLIAALIAVPMLVGGGVAVAGAHKTIELDVDGVQTSVSTFAGSVEGLLDEQDITPGEHDTVGPALEEPLSDGALVVVRTAHPIEVDVNGESREVWTTAQTTAEALHTVGEAGRAVTVAASRSFDGTREALDMPLVDGAPVDVVVDGGEPVRVVPDGEAHVEDVLALAEVRLGKLDEVVVATSNDGTAQLLVTRVAHLMRTESDTIDFETTERSDDSLYVGETRVVQEGREGLRLRGHVVVRSGADETAGERSSYVTVREPQARIVAVGTKERPVVRAAAPSRSSGSSSSSGSSGSSGSSSSSSSSGGAVSGGVWAALAQCESGGNPSIVSANGLYHGLYQFSVSTWQSVGGSGLPSQASPAEQTQRAQALQARSGWGQWPACSARLGLR